MSYSPQLNVRSAYNFQESLIRVDQYLDFCEQNHFDFAFYTDKNSLYGAAEFAKLAKAKKIKSILGVTIELTDTTLIFIAKDLKGYQNICYLSSWLVNHDSQDWKSTFPLIKPYLTNHLIAVGNNEIAKENLKDLIANEDQYLGNIMIPKICYLKPDEYESYKVINALKENKKLDQLDIISSAHYPTDSELKKLGKLDNQTKLLKEIANKVTFDLFGQKWTPSLLRFPTPKGLSASDYLKKITNEALFSLFNNEHQTDEVPSSYQERLDHELEIIQSMGFADYFLIVQDYVKFAQDKNILVGPGRGSAAGSLVSYLLGITQVDPIQYNLLFERFLNPMRLNMPDIDIDFPDDRRGEVIDYLYNKYGQFHIATIVTYQTIGAKSAIRDVARVYNLDLEIVNLITKNIDFFHQNDLAGAIKGNKILTAYAQDYPELFKTAQKLLGLPRQTGTHAAGLIFTEDDLRNHLPIRINYDGISQTQFDMNYLEDLGLIKMDLLGLRNLSTLQKIEENIAQSKGLKVDLKTIPLNDSETFALLRAGQTSGIFQLESPGMLKVVQQIGVNSIEDISAASALFRPGPQEMIPEFLKRKNQRQKPEQFLIDLSLDHILSSTYGIIVYQEQVLQVLQAVANFSLGEADLVRRVMSKKNYRDLSSSKKKFMEGALANNYSSPQAEKIWEWIEHFANYGFNKSHSVAYSYISYWLAYFKAHYPMEFYGALLSGVQGNEGKTSQYLQEARNLKIRMANPTIAKPQADYSLDNQILQLPLSLIKGVGPEFIRRLAKAVKDNPEITTSLYSFMTKMVNNGLTSNIYQALVWSGALDLFGVDRPSLSNNEEILFNFAKVNANLAQSNPALYPVLKKAPQAVLEQANNEQRYYGFYLNSHPLTSYRQQVNPRLKPLGELTKPGYYDALIMINSIRPSRMKNGQTMAFVNIGDETDQLTMSIFGGQWTDVKEIIRPQSIVLANLKIGDYQGKRNAILQNIKKVIQF